jgi:Na+-transporting NADH:ubiquinone oxidoreductase subunit NqrF
MDGIPIAGPQTDGRTLGTDWSIANVAKLLRSNAKTGAWDSSCSTSDSKAAVNRYYIRKGSAKHLPTNVSLIFMRLAKQGCWYASLCFVGADGYLPWNADAAEKWLCALFGEDRPQVLVERVENASVRQFTLSIR